MKTYLLLFAVIFGLNAQAQSGECFSLVSSNLISAGIGISGYDILTACQKINTIQALACVREGINQAQKGAVTKDLVEACGDINTDSALTCAEAEMTSLDVVASIKGCGNM